MCLNIKRRARFERTSLVEKALLTIRSALEGDEPSRLDDGRWDESWDESLLVILTICC